MEEIIKHPWQKKPTEIIQFAIGNLEIGKDLHRMIAYLLFDVGTEIIFKTYLSLDPEITKTRMPWHKREQAINGNFHELIIGIMEATKHLDLSINFNDIKWHHNTRNKLYHEPTDFTIDQKNVLKYGLDICQLLYDLLGVDLRDRLYNVDSEIHPLEIPEIRLIEKNIEKKTIELDKVIENVIYNIEPLLTTKYFKDELKEIINNFDIERRNDSNYVLYNAKGLALIIDNNVKNVKLKEKLLKIDIIEGNNGENIEIESIGRLFFYGGLSSIFNFYWHILDIYNVEKYDELWETYMVNDDVIGMGILESDGDWDGFVEWGRRVEKMIYDEINTKIDKYNKWIEEYKQDKRN